MKQIPLTKGKFAIVDDEDYERLIKFKWRYYNNGHAMKNGKRLGKGKREPDVSMSRFILGITDRSILVDHKDHNTLNNCRSNLRIATYSNNNANKTKQVKSSSKYLGVSRHRDGWRAALTKNKRHVHIGRFADEIDAAKAYDKKALELHGEFANLNFKTA